MRTIFLKFQPLGVAIDTEFRDSVLHLEERFSTNIAHWVRCGRPPPPPRPPPRNPPPRRSSRRSYPPRGDLERDRPPRPPPPRPPPPRRSLPASSTTTRSPASRWPFRSRTASSASRRSSNSTKPKPFFRVISLSRPYFRKKSSTSLPLASSDKLPIKTFAILL